MMMNARALSARWSKVTTQGPASRGTTNLDKFEKGFVLDLVRPSPRPFGRMPALDRQYRCGGYAFSS